MIKADVSLLCKELNARFLCMADASRAVTGCYCGDLLSWVMSRAKSGDAWLTVMGNVNAIGVAALAETACIVLTEDASLDEAALSRAKANSINILQTSMNAYEAAIVVSKLL